MPKEKKTKKSTESAVYYISLLLDHKEIKRIYSYCRCYIHLGKTQELPDLFRSVRGYLRVYKKDDGSFLSYSELIDYDHILETIYDNLF